ncbi:MAG: hypothetical protein IJ493_05535 [Clostridia bacterium]|nr:hypothetical protein [Clostridia bacterium]
MQQFPNNARVVFIGDSITHANNYAARVAAHYITHMPDAQIKFWNCGTSGAWARTIEMFLADDILPHNPTHATIMLGVNDSQRWLLDQPNVTDLQKKLDDGVADYAVRMERIVKTLMERGVKVTICIPAPYAEFCDTGAPALVGGHALILRFAEEARKLAKKYALDMVDFHARLSELYMVEALYNSDHIHPNDFGHYRMAECFLGAQGLEIDPFKPIAEVKAAAGLTEWSDEVAKLRSIYAAEWMIVKNYSLPTEQKLAFVEDYRANKRWGAMEVFDGLSQQYLDNKPHQAEIQARVNEIMEKFYE